MYCERLPNNLIEDSLNNVYARALSPDDNSWEIPPSTTPHLQKSNISSLTTKLP